MKAIRLGLFLSALALPLYAQLQEQHPNTARGFSPEKMYDFGEVDSVNMFNGNLTLRMPVGERLSVNGVLAYQLTLTYNSNCWEYYHEPDDSGISRPRNPSGMLLHAKPAKRANAGMGWMLSMGRLITMSSTTDPSGKNGIYESPDGADHNLYPSLHGESPDGVHYYSRDGSYIRAVSTATEEWTVELADGTKQRFHRVIPSGNPWPDTTTVAGTELRLREISDRFGNSVSVGYATAYPYQEIWTITGGGLGGRKVTTVYFKTPAMLGLNDTFNSVLLDHVDVPRQSGLFASYQFTYQSFATPPGLGDDATTSMTSAYSSISVAFLTGATLPTGETYAFAYDTHVGTSSFDPSTTTPAVVTSMKLPTNGTVAWTWATSDFPVQSWQRPSLDESVPIPSRVTQRQFGSGTWNYGEATSEDGERCSASSPDLVGIAASYQCANNNPGCLHGTRQKTSWVTAPDQTTTIAYFSLYTLGRKLGTDMCDFAAAGWSTTEYGSPFTHYCPDAQFGGCAVKPLNGLTRNLSQEIRTGFVPPANWSGKGRMPRTSVNEKALRSTWVTYDVDSHDENDVVRERNPRATSSLTFFEDRNDSGSCNSSCYASGGPTSLNAYYSGADSYGFDGFGHFRQQSALSNFATKLRTTFTQYDTALDGAGDWVLGTWSEQCAVDEQTQRTTLLTSCSDVGGVPVTKARYDRSRGVLTARRTVYVDLSTGATNPSRDLLGVFDYNTGDHGNVSVERYYGGDLHPLLTPGDEFTPLGSADYQLNHAYTFLAGSLTTYSSQYSGASFKSVDLDFDSYTELTVAERDMAGLSSSYAYDTANRLTSITPTGDAWTEFSYTTAIGATPASVAVRQRPNGSNGGATPLNDKRVYFDPWGRVTLTKNQMPDGWTTIKLTYDGLGRTVAQSMPEYRSDGAYETFSPAHSTTFEYDLFGRKTKITAADGTFTTFAYRGVWKTDRNATVAGPSGDVQATTSETYDSAGHLTSVMEASGPNNSNVATYYTYDVADRLTSAVTGAPEGIQVRTFLYDGRGFLQSELHPELGVNGNGSTSYSGYDALGHLGRKVSGAADGPFDLQYTYDSTGRLTDVTEADPASGASPKARRSVINLQYATGNNPPNCTTGTCDARNGKVLTATRHNYDALFGDVPVTESYSYQGRAGRVSSRSTVVGSTAGFDGAAFNYSQTWDDLGGLATLTYPEAPGASAPVRTVTNGFTNGLLTSVGTYASQITYRATGVIGTVTHGIGSNAVTETWAADPYNMARPGSITTKDFSGQTLWTSGTYAYDGAGNIRQIGSTAYKYDNAGRLRNVIESSAANPSKTTYWFDSFGNYLATAVNYCGTLANGVRRCGATSGTPLSISGTTNHYANVLYDDAGNVRVDGVRNYTFDSRNMMTRLQTSQSDDHYLYSADDERIALVSRIGGSNVTTWTVRGSGNQLLRTFSDAKTNGSRIFVWTEDAIWRGVNQLARETQGATYNHSIDHLGSLRVITSQSGTLAGTVTFAPFGLGGINASGTLQFAGHERDRSSLGETLDYVHARYLMASRGRFLSVDPQTGTPANPQSLNRYTYASNNPLTFLDDDGRATKAAEAVASGLEFIGSKIKNAGAALNSGDLTGIAVDTTIGSIGDVVGGMGDMFRVGDALGSSIGSGGDATDITIAAAKDTGRASALVLTMAAPVSGVGREAAATDQLAAKVNQVHEALDPIAQNSRTTAALRTNAGDIIGGGGRDLTPAQRTIVAKNGDIAAKLPGAHAEQTVLRAAESTGAKPTLLKTSRPMCQTCQDLIKKMGGIITNATTARF